MRALGFEPGVMQNIHSKYFNTEDPLDNQLFDDSCVLAQYDMLYGDRYIYNIIDPYKRVDLRLGLYDITIDSASYNPINGCITVKGQNFTPFSVILINDDRQDTLFVDENTLMIIPSEVKDEPTAEDVFAVAQIDKDKHELSRSNEIKYGD